jgi:transposase
MSRKDELIALADLPDRIANRLLVDASSGCWNWTSPNSLVGRGRGYVSVGGKSMLHHRAAWTILRGPIPEGAYLCHHCDNPRCANPDHLYVGDSKTNVADMFNRGRHWTQREPERARAVGTANGRSNTWAKRERNPKAKLTPEQVREVAASGEGSRALARRLGVHRTTIQRIRSGTSWN